MSHDHHPGDAVQFTQEFWDDRYHSADRLWSGQPNPHLVAQAAGPGRLHEQRLRLGVDQLVDSCRCRRRALTLSA